MGSSIEWYMLSQPDAIFYITSAPIFSLLSLVILAGLIIFSFLKTYQNRKNYQALNEKYQDCFNYLGRNFFNAPLSSSHLQVRARAELKSQDTVDDEGVLNGISDERLDCIFEHEFSLFDDFFKKI